MMANKPVKIGIIGAGRWGTNYFRTFSELENAEVRWLCATKESSIEKALSNVKPRNDVKTTTNYRDILNDDELDAVAIASPGSTHYKFAKEVLQSSKHVLVEKPLAFHSDGVKNLIKISNKRKKILMVGHIHRFNPGIQRLKADIDKGLFGKINFIHFSHFGNGPIRKDMSALWDFFPHSVSILLYILEKMPLSVSATGASFIKNKIEDFAAMDMNFADKIFAHSIASWLYPSKKMNVIVIGEKIWATFDDYAEQEKLKYYESNSGKEYIAPHINDAKPLTEELKHFLDCIKNSKIPLTDGYEGLKVVSILEAAQKSLEIKGMPIKFKLSSWEHEARIL